MSDEKTIVGRELTDEEVEMAAGGTPSSAPILAVTAAGLDEIGLGVTQLFTGNVSEGRELIHEGVGLIEQGLFAIRHRA